MSYIRQEEAASRQQDECASSAMRDAETPSSVIRGFDDGQGHDYRKRG
jgi:hypothetical protein